jgi:hypothetical protein
MASHGYNKEIAQGNRDLKLGIPYPKRKFFVLRFKRFAIYCAAGRLSIVYHMQVARSRAAVAHGAEKIRPEFRAGEMIQMRAHPLAPHIRYDRILPHRKTIA